MAAGSAQLDEVCCLVVERTGGLGGFAEIFQTP